MSKRLLAIFLAIVLTLCLVLSGLAAGAAERGGGGGDYSSDFVSAAVAVIREDWSDSFFTSITMTIGEGKLTIDGQDVKAAPASIENGELILPIEDIARVIAGDDANATASTSASGFSSANALAGSAPASAPASATTTTSTSASASADSRARGRRSATKEETERALKVKVRRSGNRVTITKPFQTKELIVQTRSNSRLGDTLGATRAVDNGRGLHLLQYASEERAQTAWETLRNRSNITYAEPNIVMATNAVMADRWGSERIAADRLKNYLVANNKTGTEILVAVVDTGIDASHPFLQGRVRADLGYNFSDGNTNVFDGHSHGTHVSGTVVDCTTDNVKILPVKVLNDDGSGTILQINAGIQYAADRGAKVINMSLGSPVDGETPSMQNAVNYAVNRGVTCVVAAGNEASNASGFAPACFPNVITVSAIDLDDSLAWFSNYGNGVIDVAAPGVEICSCVPGGKYDYYNGTSMASPHVAAAVAMLKLNNPAATPEQLKQAVKSTAYGTNQTNFGAGILDFNLFFGGNIPVPEPPGIKLTRHAINVDTIKSKYLLYQLRARITPVTAPDKRVTYSIDNTAVATCTADGVVEIFGNGTARVTARAVSGGYTDTCLVTVTANDSQFWIGSAARSYAGGDGTENNPWKIATAEQLALLSRNTRVGGYGGIYGDSGGLAPTCYFELTADIDLAGKEWVSINSYKTDRKYTVTYFCGHFNGNGHVIKNMTQGNAFTGMYFAENGFITGIAGEVRDLGIVDANQKAASSASNYNYPSYITGILSTFASDGCVIENCFTSGRTVGSGLLSQAEGTGFTTLYGAAARMPVIKNSYSVAEAPYGFIRRAVGVQMSNCYLYGTWSFIGQTDSYYTPIPPTFKNSFFAERNQGTAYFIRDKRGTYVRKCYCTDNNYVGGIMQDDNPSMTDLNPKPLSFFKSASTYANAANWDSSSPWDFNNVWAIDANYNYGLPYLRIFRQTQTTPTLEISQNVWNPTAAANSTSVTVASNVSWIAMTSASSWLTVTPFSGTNNGSLTLSVTANTGTAARTGAITVISGNILRTITVTQAAPVPAAITLTLNTPATVAITSGGRREMRFTAPSAGTFIFTSSNRGALDPVAYFASTGNAIIDDDSAGNSNYRFTRALASGETFVYYSGIFNDSTLSGSYTVTVTQYVAPATLEVPINSWTPLAHAGNATVTVTSNVSWTASSNATTWLTVAPASGTNTGPITIAITANTGSAARSGTVTITGGGITRTIAVTQAAPAVTGIALSLNASTPIPITSGARREVRFTAPSAGTYAFVSSNRGSLDPKAFIYSTGTQQHDDDSAGDLNYRFTRQLTAGETFVYYSGVFNDNPSNGTYSVTVTRA